jgi:hypothetical protein
MELSRDGERGGREFSSTTSEVDVGRPFRDGEGDATSPRPASEWDEPDADGDEVSVGPPLLDGSLRFKRDSTARRGRGSVPLPSS